MTCGTQRSIELLMKGEVIQSIEAFPATIPFILTILYTIAHLIFKFNKGARIIIWMFSFTAIIILVNFLIKIN